MFALRRRAPVSNSSHGAKLCGRHQTGGLRAVVCSPAICCRRRGRLRDIKSNSWTPSLGGTGGLGARNYQLKRLAFYPFELRFQNGGTPTNRTPLYRLRADCFACKACIPHGSRRVIRTLPNTVICRKYRFIRPVRPPELPAKTLSGSWLECLSTLPLDSPLDWCLVRESNPIYGDMSSAPAPRGRGKLAPDERIERSAAGFGGLPAPSASGVKISATGSGFPSGVPRVTLPAWPAFNARARY